MRCELFDVEVERLTFFSTFTQRSLEEVERVEIAPAAELAPEHRELAEIAADAGGGTSAPTWPSCCPSTASASCSTCSPSGRARGDRRRGGAGARAARLLGGRDDELPRRGRPPPLRRPRAPRRGARQRAALRLSSISQDQPHEFRAQAADTAARSLREAEPELEKLVRSGYRTVVAWARRGEAERAALQPRPRARRVPRRHAGAARAGRALRRREPARGLPRAAAEARDRARAPAAAPPPRRGARRAAHRRGRDRLLHRPARRLRGRARGPRHRPASPASRRRPSAASRATTSSSSTSDGDRVFVPSDQLHKISRYVGADAGDPPLSKLGGKQWEQQKLRARRAAEALAGELINLYAERKRRAGHAFPRDCEWQLEFEEAFPYRETPDQLDAIEAVRADMEEARPMDRLICGDVGYGKTEVALRAAFKAAEDGKQVMFLVPDDGARPAALRHLQRAAARLPVHDRDGVALPLGRTRCARRSTGFERGQGRHPDRHPPAALARRAPEGPRPADRRRGAALRRQAEGAAAPAAAARRRALAVGHADPAHAADVARRPARHLGDRDAARGPAAGEDLRRRVRRGARQAGDRARARRARARRSSCTTASTRSTRPPSAMRALVPEGAGAGRPRPDGRGAARGGDARLPARRGRRARLHHDRRVGPRHPEREHADRRARRRARAGPALPDPRARRALARARLRLPALPQRGGADRGGGPAAGDALRLHRARLGLQDRDARPRDPRRRQPARRRAVRPRRGGRLRAVRGDARRGGRRAGRRLRRRGRPSRCAWTCRSTPSCPGDYVPYEAAKIEVHRRVAGRARGRRPDRAARGAGGPLRPDARAAREPDQAPGRAHQARPRGRADGRLRAAAGWRWRRSSSTRPRVKALRERIPEAVYESGRSTVRVRVPDDAAARFRRSSRPPRRCSRRPPQPVAGRGFATMRRLRRSAPFADSRLRYPSHAAE